MTSTNDIRNATIGLQSEEDPAVRIQHLLILLKIESYDVLKAILKQLQPKIAVQLFRDLLNNGDNYELVSHAMALFNIIMGMKLSGGTTFVVMILQGVEKNDILTNIMNHLPKPHNELQLQALKAIWEFIRITRRHLSEANVSASDRRKYFSPVTKQICEHVNFSVILQMSIRKDALVDIRIASLALLHTLYSAVPNFLPSEESTYYMSKLLYIQNYCVELLSDINNNTSQILYSHSISLLMILAYIEEFNRQLIDKYNAIQGLLTLLADGDEYMGVFTGELIALLCRQESRKHEIPIVDMIKPYFEGASQVRLVSLVRLMNALAKQSNLLQLRQFCVTDFFPHLLQSIFSGHDGLSQVSLTMLRDLHQQGFCDTRLHVPEMMNQLLEMLITAPLGKLTGRILLLLEELALCKKFYENTSLNNMTIVFTTTTMILKKACETNSSIRDILVYTSCSVLRTLLLQYRIHMPNQTQIYPQEVYTSCNELIDVWLKLAETKDVTGITSFSMFINVFADTDVGIWDKIKQDERHQAMLLQKRK